MRTVIRDECRVTSLEQVFLLSLVTCHLSLLSSACFLQLDRPLYEVEAARAAHLFKVAPFDGEEAALIGPVFVDAAGGRPISMLFEEGALEENLAARAATIAFTAPQRERGDHFLLTEIRTDEAAQLALRLTGTKLCILDGARAQPLGEPLFEQSLPLAATLTQWFHKVQCFVIRRLR
jgi:hypothetical protein